VFVTTLVQSNTTQVYITQFDTGRCALHVSACQYENLEKEDTIRIIIIIIIIIIKSVAPSR
jgi:hypothetical protein